MKIFFVMHSKTVVPLHKSAFQQIEKLATLRDTGTLNSLRQRQLMLLSNLEGLIFLDGQFALTLPTTEGNLLVAVVDDLEEVTEVVVEDVVTLEGVAIEV